MIGAGANAVLDADVASLIAGASSPTIDPVAELVRQSPAVAAIIFLVVYMMKHIASMNKANREERERITEALHEQAEKCHAVQRESATAIHQNTTATKELRKAVESLNATVARKDRST